MSSLREFEQVILWIVAILDSEAIRLPQSELAQPTGRHETLGMADNKLLQLEDKKY